MDNPFQPIRAVDRLGLYILSSVEDFSQEADTWMDNLFEPIRAVDRLGLEILSNVEDSSQEADA